MIKIDPQFRQMGQGARRRRLRNGLVRGGALLACLAGLGVIGWQMFGPHLGVGAARGDLDQQIVQTESEFDIAPVVRGDTFTDIAGDPLIIQSGEADGESGTLLQGPNDLNPIRVGAPAPDRLTMVSENLYLRERRLVAALPTTREEFALFQAERSRERLTAAGDVESGKAEISPQDAGHQDGGHATSSIAFTREARLRAPLWQDLIVQIRLPADLATLLTDNGFDRTSAERVKSRIVSQLHVKEELPRGALLAVRYRMQAGQREVLQLSLYEAGRYVGSLGIGGAGQLVSAADPWTEQDLLDQSAQEDVTGETPQFRLLDVIYSAAIRNGVPGPVVGEAIALMAKVYDLDAFAAQGDRLQLLYASKPGPGAGEAGQVLYIGVTGPSGDKRCYVVPKREGGYDCFAPGARVAVVADQPVMVTPVAGVLGTRFSPPVDGKGGVVVWQAAQGTPVAAVAAGRISEVRAAGGATGGATGGVVTIEHSDGLTSRYWGLDRLPANVALHAEVKAGAVIGKVAGDPGLTFQLLKADKPVDPVPFLTGGTEVLASNAVEMLISRIIHVESGGNATARNPLSSATGLGQFIEGTWLRMMRSYRPDLVATLDRKALLDLRLEPALSRQMVRNLAQENEAFLRARGHQITPGRLYLAHFLGPQGASQVLSSDPASSVGQVVGQGVVTANPFLASYTIADLQAWADGKMNARAVSAAAAMPMTVAVKASAEVERFVALMDTILSQPR